MLCLWHGIAVRAIGYSGSYTNERCCCYSSSTVYLFESQSFRAGWDHLWWSVRWVLLFAIFLQFSLFLPSEGINLFFVAFQAFQSHTVFLQWMIKTCRGKKKAQHLIVLVTFQSPYTGHPKITSCQIHMSINLSAFTENLLCVPCCKRWYVLGKKGRWWI